MSRFLQAELVVWAGLGAIGLGLAGLLVHAWVEVLNDPGIGLVDAYWRGRVPWVPLGILPVLAGSAAAVAAGTLLTIGRGDWVRWFLLIPVLFVAGTWWAIALGLLPFPRFSGPDPVGFAYALPEIAALGLLLPALAAAVIAIFPMQPDRRIRFRRVHPRER